MRKKLLSLSLATMILFAAQLPTTAYAGTYETTHKVEGHLLYGNYTYSNLHLANGKLIADGAWGVEGSPKGCTVEFQIIHPLYDSCSLNSNGTASLGVCYRTTWTLPKSVSVVRSTKVAGAKSVSFELDTTGISDGIYVLQEVVTKGSHREGRITEDMFLIIYKGVVSLQVTSYPFPQITGFWSNDGHIAGF